MYESMTLTLEDVIAKVADWEDNLRTNAAHYREEGYSESTASRCEVRADDMADILAMLRSVRAGD